ncbi:MAG: ABC transporter ATP-binding protein [Burkholderiales bacterium]|nr:ABC transporter ATP-binding protein [Burkholderiales bacterium]MDE1928275.1 ABC transporter ATP-binding protein [Burkholderiales bacterium]MDE2158034.1 ABC transporter ATP-binding protein [Burkholderiales bacterium]MDE2504208.1 ABC transporter ATP-binding protein [Burkholderiales bacterium]
MTQVTIRGLSLQRGGVPILRDVDFSVEAGEFCVLVGPSGCGKSTLLRLISGLDDDAEGEITIDGASVRATPPARRNVAMVFQGYALYPHMTVHDNMAFALKRAGLPAPEIAARVREAARILQLEPLLQRKPGALSGGQRQRVAIGRAIVKKPKVFLFDEPLSNLDAALRLDTRVEIARLHRENASASMVYVTHDQVEAMTLADKIVLLRPVADDPAAGSVVQVGAPMTLYHHPANLFAARFIGTPGMNLVPARVAALSPHGVEFEWQGRRWNAAVAGAGLNVGDAITVGVRPEHVRSGAELAGTPGLRCRVRHIEALGEHSLLFCGVDGSAEAPPLLARTHDEQVRVGDAIELSWPADALHVFRADGGAQARRR